MDKKISSYQKLKNKINELEKDIYNMAQQDDLILACTTMTEKRLYIDLNKALWNGDIDHNFIMIECVVCGNQIIMQRCQLKERDYHGGILIHYRCEKHIVTIKEQKNENSIYEKFNAL